MNIDFTDKAKKDLERLPSHIKRKAQKKFHLLLTDYRHPSLRTRKKTASEQYEGRIDIHYRFSFILDGDSIIILTVGMHDAGLGKK